MIVFLRKIWELARPYKSRLFLGVLMGVISGLMGPLIIATAMFIYAAVFPSANATDAHPPIKHLPDYVQNWFSQIYSEDGQLISKKDYIRDIFILGRKSDMKLANTYPISYQINDIGLVIELRCDYLANDEKFTFPELKQLYRDRKIDRILE